MHNTFSILLAILFLSGCSNATQQQDSNGPISVQAPQDSLLQAASQVTLPDSALAFLRQHFATVELREVTAKKSPTSAGTFYEARLTDDTEVDFGKAGNWIEAKAEEPGQVPTSFFPEAIRAYLEANFAGTGVESIDKDDNGYELELTNDIKVHFDAQGTFLRQEK